MECLDTGAGPFRQWELAAFALALVWKGKPFGRLSASSVGLGKLELSTGGLGKQIPHLIRSKKLGLNYAPQPVTTLRIQPFVLVLNQFESKTITFLSHPLSSTLRRPR